MNRRRAWWLSGSWVPVVLAVASLGMAGCGARWTDDQRAAVQARYSDDGSGSGSGSGPGDDTAAAGVNDSSGSGATPISGAGSGSSGAPAASDSQSGDSVSGEAGTQQLPCRAPSDAPGVTATTMTVATISTLSGPVPGLGYSSEVAVRAYIAFRNSLGGVCGRQLELLTADDGADSGRFRAAIVDLGPRVLGLVGVNANGDGGGAELVEEQQIPVVASAQQSAFQEVSTVFDVNPPPADPQQTIPKFQYLFDQGIRTAAVLTLANDAAVSELAIHESQMQAAGIEIVSRQILPIATLSFDSAARTVANSGAQYFFMIAADSHDAAMAQSLSDIRYELQFEEYLTGYGSNYVELAGDAAEGTSSWIRALPSEDGGVNPEQAAFLEWMAATDPNAVPDVFATQSWASAKAFFDALEQLSGPISREALVAQVRATTSFDAGGFFGRINLGGEQSLGCVIGMRVADGRWTRIVPSDGFLC